ncbi:MAG: hypothetical protein MUC87_03705 [Bacteroidia bacterium]|jgi:hypothetical protein|nr:hypothetical protein [Bacteroidia bacterium]
MSALQKILTNINPKKLFLADSVGALVTALLTGVLLAQFESFFGVPAQTLYLLAIAPVLYAVYSFVCYLRFPASWRLLMRIIASANLLYVIVVNVWMLFFQPGITGWGMLYFVLEFFTVSAIAALEFKTTAR